MIDRRVHLGRWVLAALLAWLPAQGAAQTAPEASVRLLFPIIRGNELERLLPLAPDAQLVTVGGNPFIQLASFADARIAHRLGRSIQRRVAIPFDLAYDPGHPQLELAMRGVLWQEENLLALTRSPALPLQPVGGGSLGLPALRPSPEPLARKEPPPAQTPWLANGPGSRQPLPPTHPWLGSVEIAALELGVPISRAQPAVNHQIDYLYVRLRQPAEVKRLQQLLPIQELLPDEDSYLARVGVFTRSKRGSILMAQKIEELRQASIQPVNLIATPSAQLAPQAPGAAETPENG